MIDDFPTIHMHKHKHKHIAHVDQSMFCFVPGKPLSYRDVKKIVKLLWYTRLNKYSQFSTLQLRMWIVNDV